MHSCSTFNSSSGNNPLLSLHAPSLPSPPLSCWMRQITTSPSSPPDWRFLPFQPSGMALSHGRRSLLRPFSHFSLHSLLNPFSLHSLLNPFSLHNRFNLLRLNRKNPIHTPVGGPNPMFPHWMFTLKPTPFPFRCLLRFQTERRICPITTPTIPSSIISTTSTLSPSGRMK